MRIPSRKRASPRVVFSIGVPLNIEQLARRAAKVEGTNKNGFIVAAIEERARRVIEHQKSQSLAKAS
jgi:uncharacterized protein (DUF1778 family)